MLRLSSAFDDELLSEREGRVKVFLRKKYWLMSRDVIDEHGNAWIPNVDGKNEDSIDLTGH